ncbi:glycine cleavage system aminomethyltransferase GcvT [Halanaerobium hydrogeniformans]|nr:glycine cleavage system aminomethyltransferase GcvT [Halanaerobium hydrogeniformans]
MKETPLNAIHKESGAKMTDFGGWEMPVEYSGIIEEHLAVRKRCGLFDISHMGELLLTGGGAEKSLQRIITNDAQLLDKGKVLYTLICNENGGIIDDLVVYKLQKNKFLLVVNASNTEKDFDWIKEHLDNDAQIENRTEHYAMLALQGPDSQKVLTKLTDLNLQEINYYRFKEGKVAGKDMIISRTGYTGELGYELYFKAEYAEKIWHDIIKAGKKFEILPAGLGARDTLRLEKGFPLYGNDIDENIDPYQAKLGWVVKLDKGDFIGKEKLKELKRKGIKRERTGFMIQGRGVARKGHKIYCEDQEIGEVSSGSYSPLLKKGIAMGYIKSDYIEPGNKVGIKVRKRFIDAEIVELPFV